MEASTSECQKNSLFRHVIFFVEKFGFLYRIQITKRFDE